MSALDILEQKILQAIKIIEKLHAENEQLKREKQNLLDRISEQQKKIEEITKTDGNFNSLQTEEIERYRKREKEIRVRLQSVLEKLDKLENLNQELDTQ